MKNILIVGATSTIAQEIAKIYAKDNSQIVLWGRNKQALDVISSDLKVRGASIPLLIAHDLNDIQAHDGYIDQVWSAIKNVDLVVLAHGVLGNQELAEKDSKELLNILNSNFVSHASILNAVSRKMITQKSGTIAVLSSVAGDRGKQSNYIYGSAKAAKTTFVNGLRNRLFASGIHVTNLKLGFVDTAMTKDFKKGPLWASPSNVAQSIVKAIEGKKNSIYIPFFWKWIMLIIKSIPENVFKRMKM